MKRTIKPANKAADQFDYTDRAEYEPDPDRSAAMCADTARCFTWADGLVERGVIPEKHRRKAERALVAMLIAGTTSGPRDDRWRDLVYRIMIASGNPTPQVRGIQQRRAALIKLLKAREWSAGMIRSLRRIDPELRAVTQELYERCSDPAPARFAARLSIAVGAFNDRDLARAVDAFRYASREQSKGKPRKAKAKPSKAKAKPRKAKAKPHKAKAKPRKR